MSHWLIQEYGLDYKIVPADRRLSEIINTVPKQSCIIFEARGKWYGSTLNQIMTSLKDDMIALLQVDEILLPPLDVYDIDDDDFDDDAIEGLLLTQPDNLFVLRDQKTIIGVIGNAVAGDASTTSASSDVTFTAFHPLSASPNSEQNLLVYMHLPELAQAIFDAVLQENPTYFHRDITMTKMIKVGARISITINYDDDQIEFATDTLRKRWNGSQIVFDFSFVPLEAALQQQITISLSIQVEGIEIAQLPISMLITEQKTADQAQLAKSEDVKWHQNIFISYSRKDTAVVRQYYKAMLATGNDVFLDVESLRAGQDWKEGLKTGIEQADFVQLFWSESSAESEYVQWEWEYYLQVHCADKQSDCKNIIRPVYWTKPFPTPPEALGRFHFAYVPFAIDDNPIESRIYTDTDWDALEEQFSKLTTTLRDEFNQLKSNQRKMYQQLSADQQKQVNTALVAITGKSSINSARQEAIFKDIRSLIIKAHRKIDHLDSTLTQALPMLNEVLSSELSLQHKLEISLPIIPFILTWKTEIGAETDLDIDEALSRLKTNWQQIS